MASPNRHRLLTITVASSAANRVVQLAYAGLNAQRENFGHQEAKTAKVIVREFEAEIKTAQNEWERSSGGAQPHA